MSPTPPAFSTVLRRLRGSAAWQLLFGALWRGDPAVAAIWWGLVVLAGVLPPAFAVAMGVLVGTVEAGDPLTGPLVAVGVVFVALNAVGPLLGAVGAVIGARTGAWLQDRLAEATTRPSGIAHLEQPELMQDFTLAREFDLGLGGFRLRDALSYVGGGLTQFLGGIASLVVLATFRWWAALLLGAAWLSAHGWLRASTRWSDWRSEEVQEHQRHASYAYRTAVGSEPAKEMRVFGLGSWMVGRFADRRRRLVDISLEAMRLRRRPVGAALAVIAGANLVVFWALARAASAGEISLGAVVTYAGTAIGANALASLAFRVWLDEAARPVPVVLGLEERMRGVGELASGRRPVRDLPSAEIRFRRVRFAYAAARETPVLDGLDLVIPAGRSMAIVGQNGAGKTTLVKLLCRLYDPQSGAIEVDGVDLRELDLAGWRARIAAVFQDFVRYELPLRENVAPTGAPDHEIRRALEQAGADDLAELDTVLSRAYDGGTDLSGGQWQRVALARALCSVRLGAGVVILDEPTAQLDVRGETEIFGRLLDATRGRTTILISHRFSTVRHADQICVLEHGRVVELGSHEELMDRGGRYRTMFDLQAARFSEEVQ